MSEVGVLTALIDYYLECLAQERRDTLTVLESRIERAVSRLPDHPPDWQSLLSSSVAQPLIQQLRSNANQVALYAPYTVVTARGTAHEPLVGVVCTLTRGRLEIDPADLWISPTLGAEMSESDLQALRDTLERSARISPQALKQTLESILAQEGLPAPEPCPDIATLKRLPNATIADFPSLWLVELDSQYDRGLIRELNKLKQAIQEHRSWRRTALRLLVEPPSTHSLTDEVVLQALANPARPTFSQALAIAHGLTQPLTVITGPPGTGKTRVIGALIVEHLIQGKSVLVASKINTAVDTAVAMVERLLGQGAILRTGNQDARAQLAGLATLMTGWSGWQGQGELWQSETRAWAKREVDSFVQMMRHRSARFRSQIGRLRGLAHRLDDVPDTALPWWRVLTRWRLRQFEATWQAMMQESHETLGFIEQWRQIRVSQLRNALNTLVSVNQKLFPRLANALSSDSRARHRVFQRLARAERGIPGYPIAVSNLAISANLPLEPALFDLLIIDEASTCDPASLLPLLYRAKRAVIVGDPQQLPHITGRGWRQVSPVPQLFDARVQAFSAEFGLSAYELCRLLVGGEEHCLLNDHFRCPPRIITFANAQFYGGNLRIHTPEIPDCLHLRLVESRHLTTRTGSRLNPLQQETALQCLREQVERYPDATHGIVTPYRAVADALIQAVQGDPTLNTLWGQERLMIGTAHRFQGNEVDHLIFVTAAGSNATERELHWVEQPNLFNVAITRARRTLTLIVDKTLWEQRALRLTHALVATQTVIRDTRAEAPETLLHEISEFLNAHHVPHILGATYRGFHFDVLDAGMPPEWGIKLFRWGRLQEMDAIAAWREWNEIVQLRRHGVELFFISPLNWQAELARWLAGKELSVLEI
ncbi:MAG: DNA2/NAM7 family helicase [Armatimonadetes bacterium]|jgi:hypothetical protein|nr:DNA2/NAM7 family helicase [Armatimonadota bacterium]